MTVNDGEPLQVSREEPAVGRGRHRRVSGERYQQIASGQITPTEAMQNRLIEVEGDVWPISLLGRWIDRGQGRDGPELEREERQRAVQERRAGGLRAHQRRSSWTTASSTRCGSDRTGRPPSSTSRCDREQWLTTTTHAQESTLWSIGAFYVGEERVTADLAPFLLAAPPARSRCSWPPSWWTRPATPRSSTASAPR